MHVTFHEKSYPNLLLNLSKPSGGDLGDLGGVVSGGNEGFKISNPEKVSGRTIPTDLSWLPFVLKF